MPQDPFWNPLMGAVDFMTEDIMRRKALYEEGQRQRALREEQQGYERERIKEERGYKRKEAGERGRADLMEKLLKGDITPDSRRDITKTLADFYSKMETGGETQGIEIPEATQRTIQLDPETAEFFEGMINPNKPVSLEVYETLKKLVGEHKKAEADEAHKKSTAESSRISAEAAALRARKYQPAGARAKPEEKTKTITALVEKLRKEAVKDLEFEGRDPKFEGDPDKIKRAQDYIDFLDDILIRAEAGEDVEELLEELKTYGGFVKESRFEKMKSVLGFAKKQPGKVKPTGKVKQDITY